MQTVRALCTEDPTPQGVQSDLCKPLVTASPEHQPAHKSRAGVVLGQHCLHEEHLNEWNLPMQTVLSKDLITGESSGMA